MTDSTTIAPFRAELIDELLKGYKSPEDLIGKDGILKALTKSLVERALAGELTHHLGYEKHDVTTKKTVNSRNGSSPKTLKSDQGDITVEIPRDRTGEFEPILVKKHQRRFSGFDDKIISMYSRGMTARDIQSHLKEMYGTEVSPEFISTITDSVMEEVREWQNRPLSRVYPILYLDALMLKIRDDGRVGNKAVFLAIGIDMDGQKEVLGIWVEQTEGAKFWLKILNELKGRGVEDVFVACVDGLKGFPDAIETVFPKADIQLCIVHMVRNSLKFVPWKERKAVAADLRRIYQAQNAEEAQECLNDFSGKWDARYATISKSWRANWSRVIPFFSYPAEIRKIIYTTNAIESLNMTLKKVIKNRASFPNDDAAVKLLYLALRNQKKKWTMPVRDWKAAYNQFAIMFEERMPESK
jgi:putative transposase